MSNFYTYLIASLPMLHFGMRSPFSFEKFLSICSEFIPEGDAALLKAIPEMNKGFYKGKQPTLKRWQEFENALRNELVKIRSLHRHIDPARYLRQESYSDLYLSHIVMSAHRSPSILDAEKILDETRWRFLEELAFGHYFDLDVLIVYAFKLLILKRWEKINTSDKTMLLEETLSKI